MQFFRVLWHLAGTDPGTDERKVVRPRHGTLIRPDTYSILAYSHYIERDAKATARLFHLVM